MEKFKDEDWLREQYLEEGKSQGEIAKECDSYSGLIHYWMEKYDIPRRDQLEAIKSANRVEYARFETDSRGYERWRTSDFDGGSEIVFVARLLAVSEYGFEAVKDKEVHHKIPIPWLNTPENITPLDQSAHRSSHAIGRDVWENKDTPWRDKETLYRLYIEEELSLQEVAEKLGCDDRTVRDWMKKHEIPTRSVSESVSRWHSKRE